MGQVILKASSDHRELDQYLSSSHIDSFLLVCDASFQYLSINDYFERLYARTGIKVVKFNDLVSNPLYGSVVKGVRLFRDSGCQSIIAVGGGSVMDVAKCIKLYSNMDSSGEDGAYLRQAAIPNDIRLLAIPTTAGTGSEATRYAVIYDKGEKQSVTHDSMIPDTVLMDPKVLDTLPLYQKKSAMLDALCHGIESCWSVNSTAESKEYAKTAISLILAHKDAYLLNKDDVYGKMLEAAHVAGKAINITQTTAGHALCYKLTSLYGIAHGHAAALCVRELWFWMIKHAEKCLDLRGTKYLQETLEEIAEWMGGRNAQEGAERFYDLVQSLDLAIPAASEADLRILCSSVNAVRLKNYPIALSEADIGSVYRRIFKKDGSK